MAFILVAIQKQPNPVDFKKMSAVALCGSPLTLPYATFSALAPERGRCLGKG